MLTKKNRCELWDEDKLVGWVYVPNDHILRALDFDIEVRRLSVMGCPAVLKDMPSSPWRLAGKRKRVIQIPDEKIVEIRDPSTGDAVAAVRVSYSRAVVNLPGNLEALSRPCDCNNHKEDLWPRSTARTPVGPSPT